MLKQIRYHIIIACICLYSCHEDPEYLLDFDRGDAVPDDISITVNDAFSLNINITFSDDVELDGVSVYRASSYVWNPNPEFEKVVSSNELDGTTIVILDTGAIYGQYNSYTVASTYKDVESFFSDTVSIYFQMDAPQCTLQLTDSGIQQTIHNNYDFISGIEIVRTSKNDTLSEILQYTDNQITYIIDSLSYDLNAPLDSFTTGVYEYSDIQPNTSYRYEIRAFQDNNTDRRYSLVFSIDSISFQRDVPLFDAAALTDTSVRLYGMNVASNYFDSLVVFFLKDSVWYLQSRRSISEQTYYNESYIIDLAAVESQNCRIMAKNNNYYMLSASQLVVPLTIPGFSLVEGGIFSWGCNTGDEECNEDEFPVSDKTMESFYLSTFEISEDIYNSPGSWNPTFGSKPVDSISFIEAKDFCTTLTGLYGEYNFYIPTEVEWEYAAKFRYQDQTSTIYPWGNTINLYQANYGYQNDGPVGVGNYEFLSHHGQYDMAGNIMEWVDNCYDEELVQQNDIEGCWKVVKGGAYWSDGSGIRTTQRYHLPQDQGFNGVGFRVAMKLNN